MGCALLPESRFVSQDPRRGFWKSISSIPLKTKGETRNRLSKPCYTYSWDSRAETKEIQRVIHRESRRKTIYPPSIHRSLSSLILQARRTPEFDTACGGGRRTGAAPARRRDRSQRSWDSRCCQATESVESESEGEAARFLILMMKLGFREQNVFFLNFDLINLRTQGPNSKSDFFRGFRILGFRVFNIFKD